MTLLPHLLYLSCSLPIPINKAHLRKFQANIVAFVWGLKGHRVGLGLPNPIWYYQAPQLAQISVIYFCTAKPDWVPVERQAIPNYTLDYLLWCQPKRRSEVPSSYTLSLVRLVGRSQEPSRVNLADTSTCLPLSESPNSPRNEYKTLSRVDGQGVVQVW